MITPHVVSWQWRVYPDAHRDRRNLAIHALTAPLFMGGLVLLVVGLVRIAFLPAVAGVALVLVAVAAQGRGHRLEREPPQPFRSPLDVLVRIVVEQLVTFPRFVLSGGFAQAWSAACPAPNGAPSRRAGRAPTAGSGPRG